MLKRKIALTGLMMGLSAAASVPVSAAQGSGRLCLTGSGWQASSQEEGTDSLCLIPLSTSAITKALTANIGYGAGTGCLLGTGTYTKGYISISWPQCPNINQTESEGGADDSADDSGIGGGTESGGGETDFDSTGDGGESEDSGQGDASTGENTPAEGLKPEGSEEEPGNSGTGNGSAGNISTGNRPGNDNGFVRPGRPGRPGNNTAVNRPGNMGGSSNQGGNDTSQQPETDNPGGTATPEEGAGSTGGAENTDSGYARQVFALVNEERANAGLAALEYDTAIEQAALVRAKESELSFSHTRPNGSSFSTALTEAGISYRSSGENIAWGQRTPREVVNAWMNSSGHRANILSASYTKIGVGCYQNSNGTYYWSQLFVG